MKTFKNFFQKSISKEPTKEKGYSGTAFTYGDIYEDYNPNWQGAAKKELIPKMVNDDQVSIGLEAYKQPIKGTRFYFEPYKDDEDKTTDKDEANAKWMEDNLFNNKKGIANSVSWRQIVTEALTSLEWGHAVFETVYARSPEGWYLKKLGFRDQRTIDRWVKTDGSEGITQQFDYGIEM